ncbi:MAG TPA: hypothetical protein VF824_17770 [Thermoanaerobaculia bacterium]|jgi:hypothetical protein
MPGGPFAGTSYRFTTGLRAGTVAYIRGAMDEVLLSYRAFASAIGIIAALVSAIVVVTGIAAVLFLIAEDSPGRAIAALLLTLVFAGGIALLVPRTNVTLYDDGQPALTIAQTATVPQARFVVSAPNGARLAELRRSLFSRIGRNRWLIFHDGRYLGQAYEDSLPGALRRKLLGNFSRRWQTDVVIEQGGVEAGRIVRRAGADGRFDELLLASNALDRRVAVALATLVLGREP